MARQMATKEDDVFLKGEIVLSDVTVADTPVTAMFVTESLSNHLAWTPLFSFFFLGHAIFKLQG